MGFLGSCHLISGSPASRLAATASFGVQPDRYVGKLTFHKCEDVSTVSESGDGMFATSMMLQRDFDVLLHVHVNVFLNFTAGAWQDYAAGLELGICQLL